MVYPELCVWDPELLLFALSNTPKIIGGLCYKNGSFIIVTSSASVVMDLLCQAPFFPLSCPSVNIVAD